MIDSEQHKFPLIFTSKERVIDLMRDTMRPTIFFRCVRHSSAGHEPEKQGLLGNRFYFCLQGRHLGLT